VNLVRPKPGGWPASLRAQLASVAALIARPKRWVLPVASALLLFLLLCLRILDEREPWAVGQRASRTVTAHTDARYEDTAATAVKRQEARAAVPAVHDGRMAAARRETRQAVQAVFVLALGARRDQATDLARLNRLRDSLQIPLAHETLSTLVTVSDADLVVCEDDANRLADAQMSRALPDSKEALDKARRAVADDAKRFQERAPLVSAAVDIAQESIRPNQIYNPERTLAAQEEAEKAVAPVFRQVRRGEIVIAAGDVIEQSHLDMLAALGKTMGETRLVARLLAAAATVLLLLLVLFHYLRRFRPQIAASPRSTGVIVGSLVVAALAARLGSDSQVFAASDLAAVSAMAIVLAALLDTEVAMVSSVFMAFFADMASPGSDPRLLVAAALAGTIAAFATGLGGSRTALIARNAVTCAAANGLLVGAVSVVFGLPVHREQVGYAALGGVLASLIAAGVILVIERPLRITTELRLLELSNPSEPILKQLTLEAPGTYVSSVTVANLAEAAAEAIGADSLLARVGSYYHDIGKLKRPYYFIENVQGGPNPHDRLTPQLSARVIVAHVRDGLDIAGEIGLPDELKAFIAQHHGTTLVEYFYDKALQSTNDPDEVMESAFRYDGPRPQTRETAIVMVADTVEAASRTLHNPDLEAIRTLVSNLIQHKIEDGQLDECNLTFADIHTVQDALVRSLMATFHQRVKYPAHLEGAGVASDRHVGQAS
jgi:cyclic-di-AMP phosphodiesterase PgpH